MLTLQEPGPQPLPRAHTVACVPPDTRRPCYVDNIPACQLPVFTEVHVLPFSPWTGTWPGRKVQVTRFSSCQQQTPKKGSPYSPLTPPFSWSPWNLAFRLLPPLRIPSGRAYIPTCLEGTHIAQQLMVQTLDSERPGFKSFLSRLWLGVNGQSFPGSLSLGFLLCKMGMKTVHLPYRFTLRTKWDTMYSVAHS